jgi:hypothetical protein
MLPTFDLTCEEHRAAVVEFVVFQKLNSCKKAVSFPFFLQNKV